MLSSILRQVNKAGKHRANGEPGERLGRFLVAVLVVSVGLSGLAGYASQYLSERIAVPSDVITYFGTLWMVQATIAALVYPIVIAFVAVLLRRRATAGLALRMYMLDAAVLPAGTSAIGLVTWMGVQYLALPYVPEAWITAAMSGNAAWFVFNSSLTAWFLYRTLRFLNDSDRLETFERFAVHVALPRDVRSRLMGLILSNAQKHGFVPGPDYLSEQPGPKILVYPLGEGLPAVLHRSGLGSASRRHSTALSFMGNTVVASKGEKAEIRAVLRGVVARLPNACLLATAGRGRRRGGRRR